MKVKPGVKTSEFWIVLGVSVIMFIAEQAVGLSIDPNMVLGMFGLSGAYVISRGMAKKP